MGMFLGTFNVYDALIHSFVIFKNLLDIFWLVVLSASLHFLRHSCAS